MINRKYIKHSKNNKHNKISTQKNNGVRKSIKITLFLLALGGVIIWALISPVMLKAAGYQGKMIVNQMLAETISEVISDNDIDYSGIINIVRDNNQKITSIDTNMKAVNKIKNLITKNIALKFNETNVKSGSIPIGSLLSNPIFVGRGPNMKINVIPIGYLNSEIKSEFFSGGINQTNHKIMLNLRVDYTLNLPLHTSKTTLETDFVIADTIIVGDVPEYYTNISDENPPNLNNIKTVYPNDTKKAD